MAKPQLEDGHTDIAHTLVEALCRINLTAYETRVLWCLFRKTYGWHKKWDRISYTQWQEMTGINRWHIARTIKLLLERNIITQRGNGYKLEYAFQTDYEQWKAVSHRHDLLPSGVTKEQSLPREEKSLPREEKLLPNGVTKSLPNGVNTKEKKETIQKKIQKKEEATSPEIKKLEFDEYIEELRSQYSDVDYDLELKKFHLYWSEGHRKLKRPKLALLNWMNKAREFKREKGGQHGGEQQSERGTGTHREDAGEGDKFSGFRAIESGPEDRDED